MTDFVHMADSPQHRKASIQRAQFHRSPRCCCLAGFDPSDLAPPPGRVEETNFSNVSGLAKTALSLVTHI